MANIRKRKWTSRGVEHTAWIVDYHDQSGKRRLKTFATKKEADAWAVTALHEVKQGTHTPVSTSVTVSEATERWIAHCEAEGLEFSTIKQRRQHQTFIFLHSSAVRNLHRLRHRASTSSMRI